MKPTTIHGLELARDQLILSLHVRGVCSAGAGEIESGLVAVSLGPWPIELEAIDQDRAAWGLERVATQNLAVALDSALEDAFPAWRSIARGSDLDYFCFVRCLRNAFAHDPYEPHWVLRDAAYRRRYSLIDAWEVDLTDRHGTPVHERDYRYASGLIRLLDIGVAKT